MNIKLTKEKTRRILKYYCKKDEYLIALIKEYHNLLKKAVVKKTPITNTTIKEVYNLLETCKCLEKE
jgi:hypothetical protein